MSYEGRTKSHTFDGLMDCLMCKTEPHALCCNKFLVAETAEDRTTNTNICT